MLALALALPALADAPAFGERTAAADDLLAATRDDALAACGEDLACMVRAYEGFAPTVPGQVGPGSPHFDLEVLYHARRYEEALRLTQERLARDPGDLVLAWMEARLYYELGELYDESFDKEGWYEEMLDHVQAALVRHPGDPHLLFLEGLAKGRLGTTRGVLATLSYVDDVEDAWLAARAAGTTYASIGLEERLPCDHDLVLGIFYRVVPDSWVVAALTGTRGDLDRSLAHHEASVACQPDRIRSLVELGVTELCIGHERKDPVMLARGQATMLRIGALPARLPTDLVDKQHAPVLVRHPELACGYSRDGLQERDASTLE